MNSNYGIENGLSNRKAYLAQWQLFDGLKPFFAPGAAGERTSTGCNSNPVEFQSDMGSCEPVKLLQHFGNDQYDY